MHVKTNECISMIVSSEYVIPDLKRNTLQAYRGKKRKQEAPTHRCSTEFVSCFKCFREFQRKLTRNTPLSKV